mmetsp:Transcript_19051/g.28895  ORF Transcript_19051/g.28895 Transcript_19051/m.28895 type:complete len:129 (-) Transcript_19051:279-665(-)
MDIKDNAITDGYDGSVGKDKASEQKSMYSETVTDPTTNKKDDIGGAIASSPAANTNINALPNQLQVAFKNYTNRILANSDNNTGMSSQQLRSTGTNLRKEERNNNHHYKWRSYQVMPMDRFALGLKTS